ncbi:hypothetical protein F4810DRAFT_235928 [Camillea tinctor]|nr:hypothetical protein F4810DRAFT_235928 [Camillea tinctor]
MPPVRTTLSTSERVARRRALVSVFLGNSTEMAPCSFCERNSLSCHVANTESSRCSECSSRNLSCDAFGPSSKALSKMAATFHALEEEEEKAEAKLAQIRKQKKLWREKLRKAIARGVDSVEALEELERQERGAAQGGSSDPAAAVLPAQVEGDDVASGNLSSDWLSGVNFDPGSLSPSLLASLGASDGNPLSRGEPFSGG